MDEAVLRYVYKSSVLGSEVELNLESAALRVCERKADGKTTEHEIEFRDIRRFRELREVTVVDQATGSF